LSRLVRGGVHYRPVLVPLVVEPPGVDRDHGAALRRERVPPRGPPPAGGSAQDLEAPGRERGRVVGPLPAGDHARHQGGRGHETQQPHGEHDDGDDHLDDGKPTLVLHSQRTTLPSWLMTIESYAPDVAVNDTVVELLL